MAKKETPTDAVDASKGAVKARVLVDCDLGRCDDVVEIDAALVASLGGVVDTDPAAVAYAESLRKQ